MFYKLSCLSWFYPSATHAFPTGCFSLLVSKTSVREKRASKEQAPGVVRRTSDSRALCPLFCLSLKLVTNRGLNCFELYLMLVVTVDFRNST